MRVPSRVKSWLVRAYLRYVAWSGRTVVLGPWRSELGFEVLYWIPFLHWAVHAAGIPIDRCLAVSRGGMGKFYPAAHEVDLYTLREVDEVRLQNGVDAEQTKKLKQTRRTAWDNAVVREAVERIHGAGARYVVLHPSWMYWLFEGVWEERDTLPFALRHMRIQNLPIPNLPEGFELPSRFIAARVYERHTFPLQPDVTALATGLVQAVASHLPVVLLNQSLFADDHVDLPLAGPNIFRLPTVPPAQNFILQAAVLARCAAFVGTYGGIAQWALRYQKPSISFYTHFTGTARCHRTLSEMLSQACGQPFECSHLGAIKLWSLCVKPALAVVQPTETLEPVEATREPVRA